MDFLGIGTGELLLILLIALLVLGPERLPEVADQLGRGVGWLRRVSDEVTRSVTEELAVPRTKTWKPQSGPGPAAVPRAEPDAQDSDAAAQKSEPEQAVDSEEGSESERGAA